jgi:hypothetical protein
MLGLDVEATMIRGEESSDKIAGANEGLLDWTKLLSLGLL